MKKFVNKLTGCDNGNLNITRKIVSSLILSGIFGAIGIIYFAFQSQFEQSVVIIHDTLVKLCF